MGAACEVASAKLQDIFAMSLVRRVDFKNFTKDFSNYLIEPRSDVKYRKRLEDDYYKVYVSLGLDGKQFAQAIAAGMMQDANGGVLRPPKEPNVLSATEKAVMAVLGKPGWEARLRYNGSTPQKVDVVAAAPVLR